MRYLLVIVFLISGLVNAQSDTLEVNKIALDSIQATGNFTGLVLFRPAQKHWDYGKGTYVTHPRYYFYYHNFKDGKLIYVDEIQYYLNHDGTLSNNVFNTTIHGVGHPNTIYYSSYTRSGQYTEVTKTQIKNDTSFTYTALYSDKGKLMSHGHYINENQHGEWPTYYYNDSIKVVEVWEEDRLIDIKSDRIMFVGEKQKILSKDEYFEIIGQQNGRGWNIMNVPAAYMNNEFNVAFVMYIEETDFVKFCDKGMENDKWIQKLLKLYSKKEGK